MNKGNKIYIKYKAFDITEADFIICENSNEISYKADSKIFCRLKKLISNISYLIRDRICYNVN